MKIEKVNENQLRLTLTFQDLAERGIRLEDFIRPSDHTQALFREIMGQALEEYDFISENTPLMVEASPIAGEGISILITKVEQGEHMEKAVQKLRSFTPQTTKESKKKQKTAAKNSSEKETLLLYTFEIAAVVIVAETLFVSGLPVFGLRVPVAAEKAVVRHTVFFLSGAVKTVGKNLIYYSSVKPVGRFKVTPVNGKLPPFSFFG